MNRITQTAVVTSLSLLLDACQVDLATLAKAMTTQRPGATSAAGPQPGSILPESGIRSAVSSLVMTTSEVRELSDLVLAANGQPVASALVWSCSDDSVLTVSSNHGRAQGVKPGTAIVRAAVPGNPSQVVALRIEVQESRSVLLVRVTPSNPLLAVGGKLRLGADVQLVDGQINANVGWSSSDDTIATVNPTTGDVSALRDGRVSILATYLPDPRFKGLAELTVTADGTPPVPSPSATAIVFGPSATPLPTSTPQPIPSVQVTPWPIPTPTPTPVPTSFPTPLPTPVPLPTGHWVVQTSGITSDLYDVAFVNAGTGYAVGQGGVVLKTTDSGAQWTNVATTTVTSGPATNLYAVSFVNETTGFIAGEYGRIFRTTNGGQSWTRLTVPGQYTAVYDLLASNAGTVYACGNGGAFWRSTDGGTTWSAQSTGETNSIYQMAARGNAIWILGDSGVFRFTTGIGWLQQARNPDNWSSLQGYRLRFPDAYQGWRFKGGVLHKTTDSGATWQPVRFVDADGQSLSVNASGDVWFGDSQNGFIAAGSAVLQTQDGGQSWTKRTINGVYGLQALHMVDGQNGWAVGSDGSIVRYVMM